MHFLDRCHPGIGMLAVQVLFKRGCFDLSKEFVDRAFSVGCVIIAGIVVLDEFGVSAAFPAIIAEPMKWHVLAVVEFLDDGGHSVELHLILLFSRYTAAVQAPAGEVYEKCAGLAPHAVGPIRRRCLRWLCVVGR